MIDVRGNPSVAVVKLVDMADFKSSAEVGPSSPRRIALIPALPVREHRGIE